jgi:hypothetical protein
MNNEALLELYLKKLRQYTLEKLSQNDISVIESLKESLIYLEGELSGY